MKNTNAGRPAATPKQVHPDREAYLALNMEFVNTYNTTSAERKVELLTQIFELRDRVIPHNSISRA